MTAIVSGSGIRRRLRRIFTAPSLVTGTILLLFPGHGPVQRVVPTTNATIAGGQPGSFTAGNEVFSKGSQGVITRRFTGADFKLLTSPT